MTYSMIVALEVHNPEQYAQYRDALKPLLSQYRGHFSHDFTLAEILTAPTKAKLNRLFVLNFSTEADKTAFFADSRYQAIKQQYFVSAVGDVEIIAGFENLDVKLGSSPT